MLRTYALRTQKDYFSGLIYIFFILCITVAIGYRPDFVGSDTAGYINNYYQIALQQIHYEYLFVQLAKVVALCGGTPKVFLTILALINNSLIVLFAIKLTEYLDKKIDFSKLLLLLSFFLLVSPFFFSCQTNVLRQGTAIFFLFVAYVSYINKSYVDFLLCSLCALGFHKTTIFFLPFIFLVHCSYPVLIRILFVLCIAYLLEVNQYLLHYISPKLYTSIHEYGLNKPYLRGVRYDFVTFTVTIGVLVHFLMSYLLEKRDSEQMNSLLKIYWILTIPFFLFGFGAYSDRYLLPAWVFISVIVAVFSGLYLRKYNYSINYYLLFFMGSFLYFILKVQGL